MKDEVSERYQAIIKGEAKPENETEELFLEAIKCGVSSVGLFDAYMHLYTKFSELRTDETDAMILGYLAGLAVIESADLSAADADEKGTIQ